MRYLVALMFVGVAITAQAKEPNLYSGSSASYSLTNSSALDVEAKGRTGSHRVGGRNSHGKGSHYRGGHK